MINLKKNSMIFGTILLSFSGLICRGIGFFYRLFISRAFGEEAMGIFQLTAPVLMLAFSLTCAGTQTAISRYTASCTGMKNESLARKFLLTGCVFSLSLALLYSTFIFFFAENISIHLLQEKRCTNLLKICALAFPFSALHSCFNGYFYGKKNTKIPSFTQIAEQLVRVGTVFFLYHSFLKQNKTPTITLTCIGMLLGEFVSFFISFIYYFIFYYNKNLNNSFDSIHQLEEHKKSTHLHFHSSFHAHESYSQVLKQLISLTLPLTFNRVILNMLQSYEAISIPKYLKIYGYSDKTALSIYGVLTGMALSLVLFPSTFANSFSVLLLPAVSEASSEKNYTLIKNTIRKTIFFSLIFGFGCTVLFLISGDFCGILLFDSMLAGTFIRQLSFLCPFLYLHTTLTSILNGLKRIKTTLFINIFSLLIRLFFTIHFIPLYGIQGYLWGLLLSELFSSLGCIFALKSTNTLS